MFLKGNYLIFHEKPHFPVVGILIVVDCEKQKLFGFDLETCRRILLS